MEESKAKGGAYVVPTPPPEADDKPIAARTLSGDIREIQARRAAEEERARRAKSWTVAKVHHGLQNAWPLLKHYVWQFVQYELGTQTTKKLMLSGVKNMLGEPIFIDVEDESVHIPDHVETDSLLYSLIHPTVPWKTQWDLLIIVLVLYNCMSIPLNLAFRDWQGEGSTISVIIDLMFVVDLVLCFKTGYLLDNGEIEWDPKRIRSHYFRGWFWVDFVSCWPLDLLSLILIAFFPLNMPGGEGADLMQRAARTVRLLRVGKLFKYLERANRGEESKYDDILKVSRLLVGFLYCGHWVGCGFLFLCHLEDQKITFYSHFENEPLLTQYLTALRTAFFFFAGETVDVETDTETLFATACFIFGNVLSAVLIGNISVVLSNNNIMASTFLRKKHSLAVTLRTMDIPSSLQKRVIEYYEYLWLRHRRSDVRYDFTDELSHDIKNEIQLVLNKDTVSTNPIFRTCSRPAIVALLQCLRTEIFICGDIMVREGDVGREMFFLVKGQAAVVLANGIQVAVLKEASYFGELALMSEQRRNAHVVARTNCDLRILHKHDFEKLIDDWPEILDKFEEHNAMKYRNDRRASTVSEKNIKRLRRMSTKRRKSTSAAGDAAAASTTNDELEQEEIERQRKTPEMMIRRMEYALDKLDSYIFMMHRVVPEATKGITVGEQIKRLETKIDQLMEREKNAPAARSPPVTLD